MGRGKRSDRKVSTSAKTSASKHRFHASPTANRASVLQYGLDYRRGVSPWDGEEDLEYPPGLYLWLTLEEAEGYAWGLGDPFDIWEIVGSPNLLPDPVCDEGAYTTDIIPPGECRPVLHVAGYNDPLDPDVVIPPLDIPISAGDPEEDDEIDD